MSGIGHLIGTNVDIVVLQPEEGEARALPHAGADFAAAPFSIGQRAAIPTGYTRMIDEATDWALCRARRLRLEEQLALQEEFRMVDPEDADDIRGTLSQIERRIGEAPIEQILSNLAAVQRMLYDDSEEHEWW